VSMLTRLLLLQPVACPRNQSTYQCSASVLIDPTASRNSLRKIRLNRPSRNEAQQELCRQQEHCIMTTHQPGQGFCNWRLILRETHPFQKWKLGVTQIKIDLYEILCSNTNQFRTWHLSFEVLLARAYASLLPIPGNVIDPD